MIIWLILGIIVLLAIVALIISMKSGKRRPTDYYAFYVMGITWMVIGLIPMFFYNDTFNGLFAMGIIFSIVGIANKDKWKKNRQTWDKLTKTEKHIRMIIIIGLGILLLLGLAAFYLFEKGMF